MTEILQTQEVGSLPKPEWRVRAVAEQPLADEHLADALRWATRLGIDEAEVADTLGRYGENATADEPHLPESKQAVKDLAARYAVRLQETAGLDIIYDGEQDRSEMYQHAIARTRGFEWRGRVRAFDNRSFKKAAAVSKPAITEPWHVNEFRRLQELTKRQIKVPITGAYTLAAWSFDEYFQEGGREEFVLSLARNVIRPNIQALLASGAEWIQIDEPAATTIADEVPLFVKAYNESVRDLEGTFSVHICFSDYGLLFPDIEDLRNCSQFSLEFANRDTAELGFDQANRPAYEILQRFADLDIPAAIGLGVTSVHEDQLEPPKLVRDRVLYATDLLGDPALVYPSPDCGLRTRSLPVAFDKLKVTVEGAALAKEEVTS